jgi:hypothetical protein
MYDMFTTPALRPVTIPDVEPTDAHAGELLLQVPPEVALVKVLVVPTQILVVPELAAGPALTVAVAVDAQPPTV